MVTTSEIQAQNARFAQALKNKEITPSQYAQVMKNQNLLLAQASTPQQSSSALSQSQGGSLPQSEVQPQQVQEASTWTRTPEQATKSIQGDAGSLRPIIMSNVAEATPQEINAEIAKAETPAAPSTFSPIPQDYWSVPDKPEPTPLELAKQQSQINTNAQLYPRSGGTSNPYMNKIVLTGETKNGIPVAVNPTEERISGNLSPQDKAEYSEWKQAATRNAMTNTALFVGAGAIAPILGPTGAVVAATTGVGLSQGIKTGLTAYEGGDISKSLLTPQEALTAAETGIIFAGATKGAMFAVSKLGSTGAKIAGFTTSKEGEIIQVLPTSKAGALGAASGRVGVNTGTGFGLGEGFEAAQTGKVTPEGAVQNLAFSAGFAGLGEFGRVAGPKLKGPVKEWATDFVTKQESQRLQTEMDLYSHELNVGGKPGDLADIAGQRVTLEPSFSQKTVTKIFNVTPRSMPEGITDIPDVLRSEFGNADLSQSEVNRVAVTSRSKPTVNVFDVKTGKTNTEPYFEKPEVISPDVSKAEFMDNLKPFDLSVKVKGKTKAGYDIIEVPEELQGNTLDSYKKILIENSKYEGKTSKNNLKVLTEPFKNEKNSFDFSKMSPEEVKENRVVAKATSKGSKSVTEPYVNEKLSFNNRSGATKEIVSPEELGLGKNFEGKSNLDPMRLPNFEHMQFESEAFEFSMQPKSGTLTSSKPLGEVLRTPKNNFNKIFTNIPTVSTSKEKDKQDRLSFRDSKALTQQTKKQNIFNPDNLFKKSGSNKAVTETVTKNKSANQFASIKQDPYLKDFSQSSKVSQRGNPVVAPSYYQQKNRQPMEEQEYFYGSTPNSGLRQPPQISPRGLTLTNQNTKQTQNSGVFFDVGQEQKSGQGNIFELQTTPTKTDLPTKFDLSNDIKTDIWQRNGINSLPIIGIDIGQISKQLPKQPQEYKPTPTQPTQIPYLYTSPKNSPFIPPSSGFQFNDSGYSHNPFKISGLNTRKRTWAILSGEDVLKI